MDVVWFAGWEMIARTFVGGAVTYLVLISLLRITGPRTLAKWYAFDLIVTVALGSTFANGVLSREVPVAQAIAGFILLILLQFGIGWVAVRVPFIVRMVNPPPVLLVFRGELQEDEMRRNRVTKLDIAKAARSYGLSDIHDAAVVVLEPDGTFTVMKDITGNPSALSDVPGFMPRWQAARVS